MSDTGKAHSVRTATGRTRRKWRRGGLVAVAAGAVALSLLSPTSSSTVTVGAAAAAAQDPARPWMDTSLSPDQRADLLLAQMTLEEKVDLMSSNQEDGALRVLQRARSRGSASRR